MNKIEQIKLNTCEGYITFLVSFDLAINQDLLTLYVDEACNANNIHSDDPEEHNYVLTSDNSIIEVTTLDTDNTYEIKVSSLDIRDYSEHLKYIRLIASTTEDQEDYIFAEGIYYNALIIYEAEIYNINKYCSTCLDDKNMQLIVFVTFRRLLLEDAILLRHYKEAMQAYLELTRLLGIACDFKLHKPKCRLTTKSNCTMSACPTCANGTCSIC